MPTSHFQAMADSIVEEVNMPGICDYIHFIVCANSFEETLNNLSKTLQDFKKQI